MCLSVVSCGHELIPQQVSVDIHIDEDGSYDVALDGRVISRMYLVSGMFREAGIKDGSIIKYDIEEDIESLHNDGRFGSVCYLGGGKYDVSFHESGILDVGSELLEDFHYMEVVRGDDGNVKLSCTLEGFGKFEEKIRDDIKNDSHKLTDDEKKQYEKFLDLLPDAYHKAFDGVDWRIKIDTDAEVIENNAQSQPWFFGLFGAYEWHVTSPDDPQPYILLKLDTPAPKEVTKQKRNVVYKYNRAFYDCPAFQNATGK